MREAIDLASVLPDAPPIGFDARPRRCGSRATPAGSSRSSSTCSPTRSSTPTGTAAIEVVVPRAGGHADVQVRDHGPGIAAEDLAGLFDAYTRAGHPRENGLGLGLFVAREIVTAHAGTITVTSQIGAGTTFTVRLPAEPAPAARGQRAIQAEANPTRARRDSGSRSSRTIRPSPMGSRP